MSPIASRIRRSGLRSPAALRKAAGTSLVADIARKSITSPLEARAGVQEPVDEAVARPAPLGAELPGDERVVAGQVESVGQDGLDQPVGIGHLRADHVGPIVEVEARI